MCDANDQNDELIVPDFVHHAVASHAEPPQSPKVALQRRSEMGVSARRSMATTMRVRSGLAIRPSSLAALCLIRIEKFTPDLVPVQHRIAGVAEPVDSNGEIVEVFEIVLDGEADDVRPAAAELLRDRIQRIDHRVRQSRCHLLGHGSSNLGRSELHQSTAMQPQGQSGLKAV